MTDEACHPSVGRAMVDLVGRIPLPQTPLVHHPNTVAQGKRLHLVVGDKQRSDARLLQDVAQLMRQAFAQFNVQIGKRLVQKQQFRFGCQRPGQGDALLLTA